MSFVEGITGNDYKTLEAVSRTVEQPYTIKAKLENFDQLYQHLNRHCQKRQLAKYYCRVPACMVPGQGLC